MDYLADFETLMKVVVEEEEGGGGGGGSTITSLRHPETEENWYDNDRSRFQL